MKSLKNTKKYQLTNKELKSISGGEQICTTTQHSFLGRTWDTDRCYDTITKQTSVCRTRD